jgi:hypothetical protein
MMSVDDSEERDWHLRSNGYMPWEAHDAGVVSYDSAEIARNKIDEKRKSYTMTSMSTTAASGSQPGEFSRTSQSGGPSMFIGKDIVSFMLLVAFAATVAIAWSERNKIFDYGVGMWQEFTWKRAATKRIDAYSDFSRVSDWPARVQDTYRKQQAKSLAALMDEIPENLKHLSSARKEELGAQIWFKISSNGREASQSLIDLQNMPHRVKSPLQRAGALSVYFLKQECTKGLETACLDAAKSFAGMVWYGTGPFEDGWVNEKALQQLPTSGPLSTSAAIQSLREKILNTHTLSK